MKKIGLFLIAALVALSFMGCPTAHTDREILPTMYIHAWGGSADSFSWQDGSQMTFVNGQYEYTFKSTALDGIIVLNGAWSDPAKIGGGNLPGIAAAGVYELKFDEANPTRGTNGWFWQAADGTSATVKIIFNPNTFDTDIDPYVAPTTPLTIAFIQGDMTDFTADAQNNATFAAMTVVDADTSTYTFTYANTMVAWGGSAGTVNFKVTETAGWSVAYGIGSTALTVGGGAVDLVSGGDNNITVSGLVAGTSYTITTQTTATTATIAIAAN